MVVSGHHNTNRIAPLGQPLAFLLGVESGKVLAKFRAPLPTVDVVPRIWRRESEVLKVVGAHVGEVPACLADFGEWSLHGYLDGHALAEENPDGPIGGQRLAQLAEFFAALARVPTDQLPPVPDDWPADGDSLGFLAWLARFTEEAVHQPNRPRFGDLFKAVGIPVDAVQRFMNSVTGLTRRPFALLHTDVHRANVVVVPRPLGTSLSIIDWELALYGDPLHDLATHLVRMGYDKEEQDLMTAMWAKAMREAGHADMTAAMDQDLPVYLRFEYAQSVFPDVMRAALTLPDRPDKQSLGEASERVCRALHRAREPLKLTDRIPDSGEVGEALRAWQANAATGRMNWAGSGQGQVKPESAEWPEPLRRARLMEWTRRGGRAGRNGPGGRRPDSFGHIEPSSGPEATEHSDSGDLMEVTGVGG
ncbi:phosphotransferase family protein [Streptomyces canus]|uniref:phosphotransferase family protein n=1 Tax=Streptomyces canus TaxID=58343 RepID=UPI0007C65241|nr:aminoglycoside phosphotransferase family protein [Streptomyces canus]